MALTIRLEGPADEDAIRMVLEAAFPTPDEARLVALLRAGGHLLHSLVAAEDAVVVGHIAFSPVRVDGDADAEGGVGLAPLAVRPDFRAAVASAASSSARAHQHASAPDMASSSCWASRSPSRFGFERADRRGPGMNTRRMRRSWSWN